MATIAEVAKALEFSSRYVAELIAMDIIPRKPRGQYDIEDCLEAYAVHSTERHIARSYNPKRERAEIALRLCKQGRHKEAEQLLARGGLL